MTTAAAEHEVLPRETTAATVNDVNNTNVEKLESNEEAPTETNADSNSDKNNRNKCKNENKTSGNETKEEITPISKLLGLARPEASVLGLAVLLMLIAEGAGLLNPLILANAYDDLVNPNLSTNERMSEINQTMVIVLILHFGATGVGFVRVALMGIAGERVVARTRNQLYRAILKQDIAFFDRHKSGDLVSRLGSDTATLQEGTSKALPEIAVGFIKVVVSVGIMFWISPKLAGVLIGMVCLIMFACVSFGKALGNLSRKYQEKLGEAQTYSTEALGAIRTVQSFAAEKREEERYRRIIGEPSEYPCWWPIDCRTNRTTYSAGFFKSIVTSGFFTIIFGV